MFKYFALVLFFLVLSCNFCQSRSIRDPKSISRANSETVAFVSSNHVYCGGVWIDRNTILTAAHCVVTQQGVDEEGNAVNTVDEENDYFVFNEMTNIQEAPTAVHLGHQIKIDQDHDLALVRACEPVPPHQIATLAAGVPAVGEDILLVGHIAGMGYTPREGYVAAIRKNAPKLAFGPYIQLVMPLYKGDSGGGVFNREGELVGIATFVPTLGEAFAVHLKTVKKFIKTK